MTYFLQGSAANPDKVRALMDYLLECFNDYIDARAEAGTELEYLDALMGVHNFHVVIVLDLENRKGMDTQDQLLLRNIAATTFAQAMENKPAWTSTPEQRASGYDRRQRRNRRGKGRPDQKGGYG